MVTTSHHGARSRRRIGRYAEKAVPSAAVGLEQISGGATVVAITQLAIKDARRAVRLARPMGATPS
eukprot:10367772-Lingulodinium_polyedra.AAC.1